MVSSIWKMLVPFRSCDAFQPMSMPAAPGAMRATYDPMYDVACLGASLATCANSRLMTCTLVIVEFSLSHSLSPVRLSGVLSLGRSFLAVLSSLGGFRVLFSSS